MCSSNSYRSCLHLLKFVIRLKFFIFGYFTGKCEESLYSIQSRMNFRKLTKNKATFFDDTGLFMIHEIFQKSREELQFCDFERIKPTSFVKKWTVAIPAHPVGASSTARLARPSHLLLLFHPHRHRQRGLSLQTHQCFSFLNFTYSFPRTSAPNRDVQGSRYETN